MWMPLLCISLNVCGQLVPPAAGVSILNGKDMPKWMSTIEHKLYDISIDVPVHVPIRSNHYMVLIPSKLQFWKWTHHIKICTFSYIFHFYWVCCPYPYIAIRTCPTCKNMNQPHFLEQAHVQSSGSQEQGLTPISDWDVWYKIHHCRSD